ncbi:hypothetical protein B0H12DRAFT_1231903 [Mycena haematopus]|nr:hypothetical protein B0H12DRAFT_1231903 [Mycena haematopus]
MFYREVVKEPTTAIYPGSPPSNLPPAFVRAHQRADYLQRRPRDGLPLSPALPEEPENRDVVGNAAQNMLDEKWLGTEQDELDADAEVPNISKAPRLHLAAVHRRPRRAVQLVYRPYPDAPPQRDGPRGTRRGHSVADPLFDLMLELWDPTAQFLRQRTI